MPGVLQPQSAVELYPILAEVTEPYMGLPLLLMTPKILYESYEACHRLGREIVNCRVFLLKQNAG
jgi:hypothetical protein